LCKYENWFWRGDFFKSIGERQHRRDDGADAGVFGVVLHERHNQREIRHIGAMMFVQESPMR
jgi:hypothetical protein